MINPTEFLRKEKFVGSVLSFSEYLVIYICISFLKTTDKSVAMAKVISTKRP
jgi:high-affinity Fe2+/Pb2+ permease